MKYFVLIFGAALATTVADVASGQYSESTRTVFAGERSRELIPQCSRLSPGPVEDTWTPSESELNALEVALPSLLERQLLTRWPEDGIRALDYYRQYGGLVIAGRRIIYVHGVHKHIVELPSDPSTWRQNAMRVCDGGPMAFGTEYNPQTREFSNFVFNNGAPRAK